MVGKLKKGKVMKVDLNKLKDVRKEMDLVVQIINEWYEAMAKNNISVQPKASTILGTILAKHLNDGERDVFAESLNIKGGEFAAWYANLSKEDQVQYEIGRKKASKIYVPQESKELLKG